MSSRLIQTLSSCNSTYCFLQEGGRIKLFWGQDYSGQGEREAVCGVRGKAAESRDLPGGLCWCFSLAFVVDDGSFCLSFSLYSVFFCAQCTKGSCHLPHRPPHKRSMQELLLIHVTDDKATSRWSQYISPGLCAARDHTAAWYRTSLPG